MLHTAFFKFINRVTALETKLYVECRRGGVFYEEEGKETQLLNAEEVTRIATNFLGRLGNKYGARATKPPFRELFYSTPLCI